MGKKKFEEMKFYVTIFYVKLDELWNEMKQGNKI